jgi:hypothetical protein
VSQDRVDQLIARLYGQNHLRHGLKQLCDAGKQLHHQDLKKRKNKLKCNNLGKSNKVGGGKRKKKKRKCRDDEAENDQCVINHSSNNSSSTSAAVHSSKNALQATHGNRRKPNNVNNNNNNNGNSKMCDRDDCNNHNKKNNGNKKKHPNKKNNHSKFSNQSISNNKQKSNHKIKATKISSKDITTLRPDDIDHDIVDMTNSDEFNEDDDYEEFVGGGQTANFVDENYFDEN